jgi:DNA modification methylase
VRIPSRELTRSFADAARQLSEALYTTAAPADETIAIDVANSINLPLENDSIAAVISSPPYCTRIDYIAATRPELALLGYGGQDLKRLRDEMLGTPTMAAEVDLDLAWGKTTLKFISQLSSHSSRASETYYFKYFKQYFNGLYMSLRELRRVLEAGGPALLVVQDSYYKEIRIDLARIVVEMARGLGWDKIQQKHFPVPVTRAAINQKTRAWRSEFSAVETALVLR